MTITQEQQLAEIIVAVRKNIHAQPDYDKYNEARTREAIVAPILSAINWNVACFGLVDVEYPVDSGQGQRRIDYALWSKERPRGSREDKPAVLVEAKGVNEDINGRIKETFILDMRHYAFESGVPHVVLTNGKIWQIHHFSTPAILPLADYQQGSEVDISSGDPASCAAALMSFFKSLPLGFPDGAPAPSSTPLPGWVPCERFDADNSGMSPAIRFPDGKPRSTDHWYDLLILAAEWLLEQRALSTENVPIATREDGARYIINVIPEHGKGHPFSLPHKVSDDLYIEGGVGSRAVEHIKTLVERCGRDPSDVYLRPR